VSEDVSEGVSGEDGYTELPETYALALRLEAEGLDLPAMARVLAIELESVVPLLALAHAKFAKLERPRPEP
jgi:hypothetical protein